MLIGVISDTHLPNRAKTIPKQVFDAFQKVDLIIHAGDICKEAVLDELAALAPVKAVSGNMDGWEIYSKYPRKQIIDVKGFKIGITHGDGNSRSTLQRAVEAFKGELVDCIIFGHSHQAYNTFSGDVLLFNPGSPTDRRRSKYFSYGLLNINDIIEAKIVYFR
ncbi:MAG: phosphodiesterase [Desulfitibacter sp. BRH_c19]|nr:MAG: phosphodiesterase [Desulfitibacter sp. BRH_c19]